jgi:outer membrane receptor protein involved in Fe transport
MLSEKRDLTRTSKDTVLQELNRYYRCKSVFQSVSVSVFGEPFMETQKSCSKMCILLIFLAAITYLNPPAIADDKTADLTNLSIDELMNIEVVSTATLTETKPRLVPAAVTTITAEQIKASGARSLYELFDIYVPNLEWLRHHWEPDSLGLRGIINDRNDKFLLLVNGRNMNQRTHNGAVTELDLVELRDIHHIDVVRGPGSALYGPGAVSMVINIVTYNGQTFQGTEITGRLGAVEEFYSAEIKHGSKSDNESSFVYAGIGTYNGASVYDAPQIYPFTFTPGAGYPGNGTQAGEPMTNGLAGRDNADARGLPSIKLYGELTKDDWDFWARYIRGGKTMALATGALAPSPYGWADGVWKGNFYYYQQATGWVGWKPAITDKLEADLAFSYNLTDFDGYRKGIHTNVSREDQYYGKALLRWQPNEQHSLAGGFEIYHLELGIDSLGYPDIHPGSQEFGSEGGYGPMPRWSTDLYSLLGEWQWKINDIWTTFLGARIDDHTFTDPMFSPHASVVFTPTNIDTFKLMWARSVRANFEAEMTRLDMDTGDKSKPEKLDSIELRYERQQSKNLDLAASVFLHYNLEAFSWSQSLYRSILIGKQKEWGIELEAAYHTEKTRLSLSHSYTKLIDFTLDDPCQFAYISAKPRGYGDDLTNWSNHITKLTLEQKLDDKWTFDSSLRIYWGFPGMKDFDKYYPYTYSGSSPVVEDGWKRAYRGSYYLNMGLRYKPDNNLTIGITGYYLLGIFDKDLNKRNYIEVVGNGDFRNHAPAVGVYVEYKF